MCVIFVPLPTLSVCDRMKNFNNWVKSILIAENLRDRPRGQAQVLDLCSGKGGDIKKFLQGAVGFVVFADHAEQSVQNSQSRSAAALSWGQSFLFCLVAPLLPILCSQVQ